MAFTSGNDVNALQATDTGNVGAGAGDDRYIVSGALITANQQITITDTEGSNVIQLVTGLSITSSSVTSNAAQLTLSNGAVITILGADTFSYLLGGDPLTGVGGTTQTFAQVAANQLGVAAIPAAGAPAATGTPNVVGGSSTFALAAGAANVDEGSTATFTLTTTGVTDGTAVPYTITGVSAADVTGGLTGSATVTGNTATISVPLVADATTEGAETLTVTIDGQTATASSTVNDTSAASQTLTLTNNPDALTGGNGDDLFLASDDTLSAADVLDGGAGTDTLRYASDGAVALTESGFTTTNIEKAVIIADNTAGTTFDVTGMTGLQEVTNSNSGGNLTLNGGSAIYDLVMQNVTGGNTDVDYAASVVTGSADTQKVTLNNVQSTSSAAVSTLTLDPGIENIEITTTGGASKLVDLVAAGGNKVTVTGDQSLSITNTLDDIATVDASASTGAVSVKVDAGETLDVKGGTANDTVNVDGTLGAGDKLDGGAGTDTLSIVEAQAIAGTGTAAITNFEQLGVNQAFAGTIDMDNFSGFTKVILDEGLDGDALVDDAVTGIEVEVDQTATTNNTTGLEVDLKVDGSSDEITILLDDVNDADQMEYVTANDAETLNLNASKLSTGSSQDITIGDLNATDATTLNITSDVLLDLSDADTTNLKTVNASASTGNLDLEELDLAAAGATVTLGSGNDTIKSGAGADTLTGGSGSDQFKYTNANQSDNAGTDTIKDFVSGTDKIDLRTLAAGAVTSSSQFKGVFGDFGSAQGALTGSAGTAKAGDAVFEANFDGNGNGRLWVDIDGDGTLSNNDLRIVLEGVSSITASDLGLGVAGNTIDLTAATAVVSDTTNTNATKVATDEDDTVTASTADLSNSTIDGELGNDTLTVEDNATSLTSLTTAGANGVALTAVENVVFNNTSGTINLGANTNGENITVNGASGALTMESSGNSQTIVVNNTSGTNASTIDLGNHTGLNVTLGAAGDTVDITSVTADGSTVNAGAGTDTLTATGALALDLSDGSFTNFEALDLNDAGTAAQVVTLASGTGIVSVMMGDAADDVIGTVSQLGALTTIDATTAGDGEIRISDGGSLDLTDATIGGTNDVGLLQFSNSGNSVILDAADADAAEFDAITGGTGTDTLTLDLEGANAALAAVDTNIITAVENLVVVDTTSTTATAGLILTNTSGFINVDTSAITTAQTHDIGGLTTANGNTTITLGSGVDTLTNGISGAGNNNLTLDFGSGNATIDDIVGGGTGDLEINMDVTAGSSTTITFSAVTAQLEDFGTTTLDFDVDISSIKTAGGTNNANQLIFLDGGTEVASSNATVDQIIFDVNGDGSFGSGDIQLVGTAAANIIGANAGVSIVSGDLVIA